MAYSSVPALPLCDNDVSILAQTFQLAFDYYCNHHSPFQQDYMKRLCTAVGLGFTAVLVDGDLLLLYQRPLRLFLDHRHFDKHPGMISALSLATAEMVSLGGYLFRVLNYPGYYNDFARAVEKALSGCFSGIYGDLEESKQSRAQAILDILLPKLK